jgi:predicted alpha/beta-fold hydrolase
LVGSASLPITILIVSSALMGCVSVQIAAPSVVARGRTDDLPPKRSEALEQLVRLHDQDVVVFPASAALRGIGPGLVTLGSQANEIGQTALDQVTLAESSLPIPAALLTGGTFKAARQPQAFAKRSRKDGERDFGNVPQPMFEPVWIPVPLRPDLTDALPRHARCPVASEPTARGVPLRDAYFCLYAELAVQPSAPRSAPAPMIFVVAGLLHSSRHQYVRETASILFARGYSVALLDMRDHGGTFHGQPWLPTTLGTLEGHDLVNAARSVRSVGGPARFGVTGFSAGGLFATRAFIHDRTRRPIQLTEGVLAVSPLLDLGATLERMGDVGDCCALCFDCIDRHAMAYYFMDLLKLRMQALGMEAGKKDISAISATDYIENRMLPFAAYRDLPDPRSTMTPHELAGDLASSPVATDGEPPRLAILSSLDDPVVGKEGVCRLRKELGTTTQGVGIYTPARGGHIALSVVSPAVARAFVRRFFDR